MNIRVVSALCYCELCGPELQGTNVSESPLSILLGIYPEGRLPAGEVFELLLRAVSSHPGGRLAQHEYGTLSFAEDP